MIQNTLLALTIVGWLGTAEAAGGETGLAFWPVFNFLLLMGLLAFALRKPIGVYLKTRHEGVKEEVAKAEAVRLEAEELKTKYQQKLSSLDEEVDKILNEARKMGEQERKKILDRAERLAEKIREDAIIAAEKEKGRLIRKLEQKTLSGASVEAAKMLKNKATQADHQAFVQELIRHLETQHG